MLAAIFAAAFLLIGCGGTPATGWSGANVAGSVVYFGGVTGKVFAVAASDGAVKWEFPKDRAIGPLYSTPAVSDTTVYVGAFDKKLYALDARSEEHTSELQVT